MQILGRTIRSLGLHIEPALHWRTTPGYDSLHWGEYSLIDMEPVWLDGGRYYKLCNCSFLNMLTNAWSAGELSLVERDGSYYIKDDANALDAIRTAYFDRLSWLPYGTSFETLEDFS